jgi:benzoyl-CoA reductase subunit B
MNQEGKVKTAGSRKSVKTAGETWAFIKEDYRRGHELKKQGKPIAWSCALVEKDLFYAMGVTPFFPEQFAALCAVMRKEVQEEKHAIRFAKIAEQNGYPSYLCGYCRVVLGYLLQGDFSDGPLGGMPRPDLMLTTTTRCDVRLKWFEDMAQRLGVPLFTLDRPERVQDNITGVAGLRSLLYPYRSKLNLDRPEVVLSTPSHDEVEYYIAELRNCISFIEKVTGYRYDPEKLNECLEWSYRMNEGRQEILHLRKAVPSPMGCADGFATMYPGYYAAGTKRAYEFYSRLRDDVKEKVVHGIGQIPDEKFRLLWYGLPTWFNLSIFNYFEKFGGVFVYEPAYNPQPLPPRRPEDPLREMALRTLTPGTSVGSWLSSIVHDCREYKINGVVLSYLITCRPYVFPAQEIRNILQEELGIPTVSIEGDLVDERLFSEAQVYTRLDAFAEQILASI